MSKIKTRLLILSDTHGLLPHETDSSTDIELETTDPVRVLTGYRHPLPAADVVLHCGDLTKRSEWPEYDRTFAMLRSIQAPLKLVIAGNHDLSLDKAYKDNRLRRPDEKSVWDFIAEAEQDGVRYLTEGTYEFTLQNGALLKVYASQYTPAFGGWAFQYTGRHHFDIPDGVDVAMTHGPPYGVLDEAGITQYMGYEANHAGCSHLMQALFRARPRIHCFGHIHEAWGGYLGTWLDHALPSTTDSDEEEVLDESKSRVIQTMRGLKPMFSADMSGRSPEARKKLADVSKQRGVYIDLTKEQAADDQQNKQTLFVNAAIMDIRYSPSQPPWIVDIDLLSTGHEHS